MKFISYIFSSIFLLAFLLILLIFHPLQWLANNVFGYNAHKVVVDYMNLCLTKSTLILGVPCKFENTYKLEKNKTYIFVSNHQSLFDIPAISWHLRAYHPKFVSKVELGKGIPSVSYNLNHGGSVLIDRKNGGAALKALMVFGKQLKETNRSAVIFPEGTRSKTGKPRAFANSGLKVLTKMNKDAYVVPITVNNSWSLFKYGKFPFGIFTPLKFKVHEPIKINSMSFDELFEQTETIITKNITNVKL